jgi:glutaredoxin
MKQSIFFSKYLLLLFALSVLSFKVIDKNSSYPNKLLQELAIDLDKHKIDIIQNWRSNATIGNDRWILAPLANWNEKYRAVANTNESWVNEFVDGYMGGLAAVQKSPAENSFFNLWRAESEEKRIFISFTQADREAAYAVKSSLESKGYVVFIYLNEFGQPSQSASEAGAMMKTAGQHFIIDSKNARKSPGVIIESQILETRYHPKLPTIKVYGRDACHRTTQIKDLYSRKGVKVDYINIDDNVEAANFVLKNGRFLEENMLPLVTVNGKCITVSRNQTITSDLYKSVDTYNDIKNMYPNSFPGQKGFGVPSNLSPEPPGTLTCPPRK